MRWMSPELFNIEETGSKPEKKKPTKESDCYALGMTTYEVLTGDVPFVGHSDLVTMLKVLEGKRPERPRGMKRAWFSDDLWGMLKLSWATNPMDRPSIEAMLECFVRVSDTWGLPSPQVEKDSVEVREGEGVESDEGPETDGDPGSDEDTETDVEVPGQNSGEDVA